MKLTEDETVDLLEKHLQSNHWDIISTCKGHQRGIDLIAVKGESKLLIEVKGARANPDSHLNTRSHFNSGQIKTHFGKAIIKALETQLEYPDDIVAIAHPFDEDIVRCIAEILPRLRELNIKHYWVSENELRS